MKPSRTRWITNTYPLVDARLDRHDCRRIVTDAGLPEPMKSACVFCPYHSNSFWRTLKRHHPEEWEAACAYDEQIRNGAKRGAASPTYVHRSMVPLCEADVSEDQLALFGEECEGYCGV